MGVSKSQYAALKLLAPALLSAVLASACGASTSTSTSPSSTKCSVSAAPPAESVAGDGGTSTIAVTATADCSWTASSASEWITSLSPASGRGAATVTFSATANPTPAMRVGAVVIEGSRVSVQQQPGKCSVVVSPRSLSVGASGRTDVIAVQTSAECKWSASTTASWIQLSDASGTGSAAINYRVDANSGAARTAAITIA